MIDQLSKFPVLEEIYKSLELTFKDSIIEGKFDKEEFSIKVKKEAVQLILKFLKQEKGFNALEDIIALDNLSKMKDGQKRFSILYQLYKFPACQRVRVTIDLNEDESVNSIYSIFKSSDWAEREIFDMFGINFTGHPNLLRIYMPDDFKGFPLRKDFPLEGKQ